MDLKGGARQPATAATIDGIIMRPAETKYTCAKERGAIT